MERRIETLMKWMNKSFIVFESKEMKSLNELSSYSILEKILLEIDQKFFGDLILLFGNDSATCIYNLNLIYKHIKLFYKNVIGVEFEENFFNPKEAIENSKLVEFKKLAELITGIAAQCERRADYLQIMQKMNNEESSELFTILTERISAYTEDVSKLKDISKIEELSVDEDEQNTLYIRIDNLENENSKLVEEIKLLTNKITDLTKSNFTLELMIKESESKYQDLINTLGDKNDFNNKEYEDSVMLSIQISELKGKLEAKEKNLLRIKEEKDKVLEENKSKIVSLQKENESLREKSVKYDVLKEKMEKFSIDELNSLKAKLIQSERIIKEQEEKIKKLKTFDVDRSKLLKKIEELNFEISHEAEKSSELLKENDYYKDMIIQLESDIKFYKKKAENISNTEEANDVDKTSLYEIENNAETKKSNLDLETKLKFLQSDKENLTKEKNELDKLLKEKLVQLEEYQKEISKNSKKLDKYSKYKEEKHTLITKITDLMEKLHEAKSENENLKMTKGMEISELENKYMNQINGLTQKHSEDLFSIKETLNIVQNENSYLKKEIKKSEELYESNKLYIDELQRKINNPNSENKLIEIETRLKELSDNENIELKRKINEKDELISNLFEKTKTYENLMKDYSQELEKIRKKANEIPVEEMKKKDELINHYKNLLEQKEKSFLEEQQLVSSLFHQVAMQYMVLKSKLEESGKAINI